jgi:hypothetical protein
LFLLITIRVSKKSRKNERREKGTAKLFLITPFSKRARRRLLLPAAVDAAHGSNDERHQGDDGRDAGCPERRAAGEVGDGRNGSNHQKCREPELLDGTEENKEEQSEDESHSFTSIG